VLSVEYDDRAMLRSTFAPVYFLPQSFEKKPTFEPGF
jgi:hypothetical protein